MIARSRYLLLFFNKLGFVVSCCIKHITYKKLFMFNDTWYQLLMSVANGWKRITIFWGAPLKDMLKQGLRYMSLLVAKIASAV